MFFVLNDTSSSFRVSASYVPCAMIRRVFSSLTPSTNFTFQTWSLPLPGLIRFCRSPLSGNRATSVRFVAVS